MQIFLTEKDNPLLKNDERFSTYSKGLQLAKDIGDADYMDIAFVVVPYVLLQQAYKLSRQSTHIHTESLL